LDLVAQFESKKVSFKVKVNLTLPESNGTKTETNEIVKEVETASNSGETEDKKTESALPSN